VLLPGCEQGHNLPSTSVAIGPGTDDIYIVTNDAAGGQGAIIFHARVFEGPPRYSHG
jgi:lactonase